MKDSFALYNAHYREIRENCLEKRLEFLRQTEWDYEAKKNGHVRIFTPGGEYDVWLSTGKWTKTGTNKYQQGFGQFVKIIEDEYRKNC